MAAGQEPDLRGAGQSRSGPGQPGQRPLGLRMLGSGVEAIDVATRMPLYLLSASEPLLVALVISGQAQAWGPVTVTLLILSVIHALVCTLLLRAGLARYLDEGRLPWPRLGVATVVTLAGVAIATAADAGGPVLFGPLGSVSLIFCAALTGAVAALLSSRWLFLLVALQAIGAGVLESTFGDPRHVYWAVNSFF